MLIKAEKVSISFGQKSVLRDIDLNIDKKARLAIIGRNGSGKSTLIKLLIGEIKPDTGTITRKTEKIGYLSQFPDFDSDMTVSQIVGRPYGRLSRIADRMYRVEKLMASPPEGADINALADECSHLYEEFTSTGGLEISSRTEEAMKQFGLPLSILDRRLSEISGGQMTKVMLARVVVQAENSDILFLDEPTSHLDMETVEWLEDYLLKYPGALVVVSHDRYFLDNVVRRVVEIENSHLTPYKGNYSYYIDKKRDALEIQRKTYERNQKERKRQKKVAMEMHARSHYSAAFKTRLKMLERMEEVERPEDEKEVGMKITAGEKSSRDMLVVKALRVVRGEHLVLDGIDIELNRGDKLGVFGPNGSGKTTLIKALIGEIPATGELWLAPGASVGYFAQGHETLRPEMSAEEQMLEVLGKDERLMAREILARFLLKGKDVERPISTLSGGERARVALALLMAEQHNLLILDEPTNYLDIPSREAVESALRDYGGTIIVVTHDRYLLDAVCNHIGELRDGKMKIYAGNYSALKGQRKETVVEETVVYRVVSSFTNWAIGKKYRAGEQITIADSEMSSFEWALKSGKLKRMRAGELKKVKK